MRSLRRFAFVLGATGKLVVNANPLDDQHAILDLDIALAFRCQLAAAGVDPTRLQRASQGAGHSTRCCRDHVVQRGRARFYVLGSDAIVLGNRIVDGEDDRVCLRWQIRPAKGSLDPLNAHL